jgi:hypothetical protein
MVTTVRRIRKKKLVKHVPKSSLKYQHHVKTLNKKYDEKHPHEVKKNKKQSKRYNHGTRLRKLRYSDTEYHTKVRKYLKSKGVRSC